VEPIVAAKTNLMPGQANDARIAGPKHLDFRPTAEPKLLKSMNVIGMAENIYHPCRLSGEKAVQRDGFIIAGFHEGWSDGNAWYTSDVWKLTTQRHHCVAAAANLFVS
jgi:hypothetical protein